MSQQPISVSKFLEYIKESFAYNFSGVYLEAEIAQIQLTPRANYLTLKDTDSEKGAVIKAVYFATSESLLGYEQGNKVEVFGELTLFPKQGQMQLNIKKIRKIDSLGAHLQKIQKLKEKIIAQALHLRKQSIPQLPKSIGLITSETGSVLQDMLRVFKESHAGINIVIYPTVVQGIKAVSSICEMIKIANLRKEADLIIVARGGGSFEELLPFSDEQVILAVLASQIPIISAIGHETDDPIINLVSDFSSSTPTAAANYAIKPHIDLLKQISITKQRFIELILSIIREKEFHLQNAIQTLNLYNPEGKINLRLEQIKQFKLSLNHSIINHLTRRYNKLSILKSQFVMSTTNLQRKQVYCQEIISSLKDKAKTTLLYYFQKHEQKLIMLKTQLKSLSPESPLNRGYAMLSDSKGKILKLPPKKDQLIQVQYKKYNIEVKVIDITKKYK